MEFVQKSINGYIILFFLNESELNIILKDEKGKGKDKLEFIPVHQGFKDHFKEYILDFPDLIKKIDEGKIIKIGLKEVSSNNENLKYLLLEISKNSKIFISLKIFRINMEYYLTKGPKNERINPQPYSCNFEKDYFNIDDISELLEKENILKSYIFDSIKYYDYEKEVFREIKNDNIQIKKNIILEFHIKERKNPLINNLKLMKKYYSNEIIKIKNKINKYSDIVRNYDLIYLYASPMIKDDYFNEHEAPISYMKEIRSIMELMKATRKKFKCKFECINEEVLRDILKNYKTKILHISAHGSYNDGKYSLNLENLKNKGKTLEIDIDELDYFFLNSNRINMSQIDLVFVSTCYSEDLAKKFLNYGAKNVIYIKKEAEVNDTISVLFTKFFYGYLISGKTIKDSYDNSLKQIMADEKVCKINYKSDCSNHFHIQKHSPSFINFIKSKNCKCFYDNKNNYHIEGCPYYEEFKLYEEAKVKKVRDNIYEVCCCDLTFEHDEIKKIRYESQPKKDFYQNISSFKLNKRGKLFINSTIRFYYDQKKFFSIKGRRSFIGRVFNSITKNEKISIFFGKKGFGKLNFVESLCVYLYERKIINNYELFRINSEADFNDMKNQLYEYINSNKSKSFKGKKVKVIKFDNEDDNNTSINYLNEIYKHFCNDINIDFYFIFIFNVKKGGKNDFIEIIKDKCEKYFNREIKIDEEILFYAKPGKKYYSDLFDSFLKGSNLILTDDEKKELLNKAENKPKNIKIIENLLLQGKTVSEITKMSDLSIVNDESSGKEKRTFLLYYLLSIMPSGLPVSFLKLIFEDYDFIKYDKSFITKSIKNNWNLIKNRKYLDENFNQKKEDNDYNKILFKALKVYTKILNYFIDINREKINNKDGNIHYIYNSYNREDIWISKISNEIAGKIKKKVLKKDFNIHKHKENIINLISIIINKIESLRSIEYIKGNVDFYLENILLLFPSYFFLKKENLEILQICIGFCDKLIKQKNQEHLKNEQYLLHKLLLFQYSVDETKNQILKCELEEDLKKELDFLNMIRNKDYKVETLQNLENNFSSKKKFYLYYEKAIVKYKEKNYTECLNNLQEAMNLNNNINDITKNRVFIDFCTVFRKCYNTINDYYKLIEYSRKLKAIMKSPKQKDIYFEAYNLKNELYNLLEPDIVMLNSNPLKNKYNYDYSSNNQYYILNELKQNIKSYIRIKSSVLNIENLNIALKGKGKILIIQSDDFTENGDIMLENEKGESIILPKDDFIQMIKGQDIKYQIIILCFPKSSILIEYFDNLVDYLITFENFNHFQNERNIMKKYNMNLIQFLIDFITSFAENKNNNDFEYIFKTARKKFIDNIQEMKFEINSKDYIIFTQKKNINSNINNQDEIKTKKVFLYGPFLKLKNIYYEEKKALDYSSQIYDLVEYFNHENIKIFYYYIKNVREYLNLSLETMKFFYRHKTYCELFIIDFSNSNDKILLISLIRKLKEMENEYTEESETEEDDEDFQKKFCFILIYNCKWIDLVELNIYSILNSNNSFIIICQDNLYEDNKSNKNDGKIGEKFKEIEFFIIEELNDNDIFFLFFDYDKFKFIDEETIYSSLKMENENIEFDQMMIKEDLINNKLEILNNGNLYEYLKSDKPLEGDEFVFPFDESEVRFIFFKILKTIAELHFNNACHLGLDLTCIVFDEKYNPIIINLGTVRRIENGKKLTDYDGKKNEFIPPELYIENQSYDGLKVDIFSLGIILFILLFRRKPFKVPLTDFKLYQSIKEGREEDFWKNVNFGKNKEPNEKFKKLFIKMVGHPNNRYSIDDIINSEWMEETKKLFRDRGSKKFDKLEKNIYTKFQNITNKIKEIKEKAIIIEKLELDGSKEKFDTKMTPKNENADINKYNIIKIKILSLIKPSDIMNELYGFYKKNNRSASLDESNNELKFSVTEFRDAEKKNEKSKYSIELYKDINSDEYFLKFDYISGGLSDLYNGIEFVRQHLESFLKDKK